MKPYATCVLVFAAVGVLPGCGGGSGVRNAVEGKSFNKSAAIRLTGSTAPKETSADQLARAAAIGTRSVGFIGAFYGETNNPAAPTFNASCGGDTCGFRLPQSGEAFRVSLADFNDIGSSYSSTEILTRNDVTLVKARSKIEGGSAQQYGAWMNHAGFAVVTGQVTDVFKVSLRGAAAGGGATGTRPTANATWRGVMVGTPARGKFRDNILQGDAELTYTALDPQIDARFSNIQNLDRQAPHSVREVRFDDVPVASDGAYSAGGVGNRISGGFAGPDHAETAGIFEQRGIVGSYGAKKQ